MITKTQTGTDLLNHPIYTESRETVANVLVGQPTGDEITDTLNLTGKKLVYTLGIPKGDAHVWKGQVVEIFGERFRVIGYPEMGIEANIPGPWHKKVKVERIE